MNKMRQATQSGDAEVAGGNGTPLLGDLRRSINGAMLIKTQKRSF